MVIAWLMPLMAGIALFAQPKSRLRIWLPDSFVFWLVLGVIGGLYVLRHSEDDAARSVDSY